MDGGVNTELLKEQKVGASQKQEKLYLSLLFQDKYFVGLVLKGDNGFYIHVALRVS